tara:strand:+ start:8184 stop:8870 length:687 start_codon:yes stop_codon:yes gene_type:complete
MRITLIDWGLSFPVLFTPQSREDNGDLKYSATFVASPASSVQIKKDDESKTYPAEKLQAFFAAAIKKVACAKFGDLSPGALAKIEQWAWNKADGSHGAQKPKSDDDGNYWGGYEEGQAWYITAAKNQTKLANGILKVLDGNKDMVKPASGLIHAGCRVNAIIDLYAMDHKKAGKIISASLEGVQWAGIGENFGGSPDDLDTDEFGTVAMDGLDETDFNAEDEEDEVEL